MRYNSWSNCMPVTKRLIKRINKTFWITFNPDSQASLRPNPVHTFGAGSHSRLWNKDKVAKQRSSLRIEGKVVLWGRSVPNDYVWLVCRDMRFFLSWNIGYPDPSVIESDTPWVPLVTLCLPTSIRIPASLRFHLPPLAPLLRSLVFTTFRPGSLSLPAKLLQSLVRKQP